MGIAVTVYAAGLPPPPPGRVYQLRLMRGRAPGIVSGGVFQRDAQGRAVVEFRSSDLTRDVNSVAVTHEPPGGSRRPTGNKLFIGVKT